MSFASKVVVVTGSSGGIGAAIATAFAREGAEVVLVGRNESNLSKVAKQLGAKGKPPHVIKQDVSSKSASSIIDETVKKFGKLDILVNNAGIMRNSSLVQGTFLDIYDEQNNVNLRSAINLTQTATPHLIASKGNVINISSVCSKQLLVSDFTAYGMTKAAMDLFSEGAALELGKYGVRVNTISPGPVTTELFTGIGYMGKPEEMGIKTALNRWSEPKEIADLALYVASDKAKGVTGSNFTLDNGFLLMKCAEQANLS